jgi:hypothetical protein
MGLGSRRVILSMFFATDMMVLRVCLVLVRIAITGPDDGVNKVQLEDADEGPKVHCECRRTRPA